MLAVVVRLILPLVEVIDATVRSPLEVTLISPTVALTAPCRETLPVVLIVTLPAVISTAEPVMTNLDGEITGALKVNVPAAVFVYGNPFTVALARLSSPVVLPLGMTPIEVSVTLTNPLGADKVTVAAFTTSGLAKVPMLALAPVAAKVRIGVVTGSSEVIESAVINATEVVPVTPPARDKLPDEIKSALPAETFTVDDVAIVTPEPLPVELAVNE